MKKPIIYSVTESGENAPIFSQGDYDVFVGTLKEDSLPMYVVINRTSGVVEFTHEATPMYKEWLNHFAPVAVNGPYDAQLPLSFAMKN